MRNNNLKVILSMLAVAGLALADPTVTPPAQQQKTYPVPAVTPKPKHRRVVESDDAPSPSRTVYCQRGQTIHVRTQKHFATAVQIRNEKIVKIVGGDNDNWAADLDEGHTVIVLRPKNGAPRTAQTSMVVTTTKGNIYMIGVALSASGHDELITVEPSDKDMKAAAAGPDKFVDIAVVYGLQAQLADKDRVVKQTMLEADKRVWTAEDQAKEADHKASEQIAKFRASYPLSMSFGYDFKAYKSPFHIESVWHDERFTYIRADPDEVCAVYAEIDGKPLLLANAEYKDGTYTIPRILYGDFYLKSGKKKGMIHRKEK